MKSLAFRPAKALRLLPLVVEETQMRALLLNPEPAWTGHQVLARGYSRETGTVVVAFLFREQLYQVRTDADRLRYPFRSRRAAMSFAAELCEES